MEITETSHYVKIEGVDNNGDFSIRIFKDCSQLQLETEDEDAYIDINYKELKTIRDTFTEVLENFEKKNNLKTSHL